MGARDQGESHRASTPLELLFDLTFVVAVSFVVAQLAHELVAGHVGSGIINYLMVFFAIWWAWMNFTWFASAYDTDDAPYRILTMVQMGGVLVLAAGVGAASSTQDYATITYGYVIMRVAMVLQWLRAAASDPVHRATARRYAAGIAVVQVGWLLRLLLPPGWQYASFAALVLAEITVPLLAERASMTTWHPHHIAERYGLFVIIVLGESVMASTVAVSASKNAGGLSLDLAVLAVGGLVLLFGLWWVYFLEPMGEQLADRRDLSFIWGYGHYGIFAALAAVGGGLEVTIEAIGHHGGTEESIGLSPVAVSYAVAIPVAVFLLLLGLIHARMRAAWAVEARHLIVGGVLVLIIPLGALWWSAAWSTLLVGLAVAALVVTHPLRAAGPSLPDPIDRST